ncbi:MAG TPA: superoxide dismutase [Patescibacteria group bacterium]|nr:superoxide dismutase [Patescibacteria group bacterium]
MYTLPDLPYDYDALAPFISDEIQHLHHDKHHKTYVDTLNKALESHSEWQNKPIEELITSLDQIPEDIRTVVRNHGGGHINHSAFWEMMAPKNGQEPTGTLLDKIQHSFGDLATFKTQFGEAATKVFGSGWEWLVLDGGEVKLMSTPNQDSPLTSGKTPLLGLDVWEHAYYLQYYNKRADYIEAWWNVVNWDNVAKRFDGASK